MRIPQAEAPEEIFRFVLKLDPEQLVYPLAPVGNPLGLVVVVVRVLSRSKYCP